MMPILYGIVLTLGALAVLITVIFWAAVKVHRFRQREKITRERYFQREPDRNNGSPC